MKREEKELGLLVDYSTCANGPEAKNVCACVFVPACVPARLSVWGLRPL